jgi:hypothetical protein
MKEVLTEEEEMFLRSDPKDIDEYELKVIAESISVRCFHFDWTSETKLFQHWDTSNRGSFMSADISTYEVVLKTFSEALLLSLFCTSLKRWFSSFILAFRISTQT